ncbi:MAG TPA: deoxyguanosinetriphosphate triphosphohydrolase [Alphaproteobacteria bacterium]|nr:deoxyguanosinetriphosphate triphosphohydrolase [Alphaproteobacteria bacterium]
MKARKQPTARFIPARAPFACVFETSRGRLFPEPPSAMRSEFQRDRDRIIHSTAFRRLKHKTQVFVYHEGDHYRTRLTHSLEVAQIARTVGRALGLDEDLAEAVALAHDLGHTPFGHTGEEALNEAMTEFGGFDHNAQTLRILTKLEHRYAGFDGLNLTWECLEGVVKHNGPLTGPQAVKSGPLPAAILEYAATHDLWLDTWPGAEAQVASLADDIAYNNHDVDDGLRAELFSLADLAEVPLVGATLAEVRRLHGDIEASRLIGESIRRLIDRMATDLLDESRRRLGAAAPRSADDVRRHRGALIAFSDSMLRQMQGLREFLHARMYRHERVNQERENARRVVGALFAAYLERPERLPQEWRVRAEGPRTPRTARLVADYIAGMTDRFAFQDHARVFGERR